MNERNARKVYQDYIEQANDETTTRELIAYQEYGDCFAIIQLETKIGTETWKDYQLERIDWYGNIDPIRTFATINEAKIALLALAYKSKPIIELPF